jgi:hypothetical protein
MAGGQKHNAAIPAAQPWCCLNIEYQTMNIERWRAVPLLSVTTGFLNSRLDVGHPGFERKRYTAGMKKPRPGIRAGFQALMRNNITGSPFWRL